MRLTRWLDQLRQLPGRSRRQGVLARRATRCRLADVELLEARTLLTPALYADEDVFLRVPPYQNSNPGFRSASLNVPDDFIVQDVNVQLTIEHEHDSLLFVYLVSPDQTVSHLFNGVGGSGANFTETMLDQQATVFIADAAAPFTGSFRPVGDLSVFNGLHSLGNWTMYLVNDDEANEATLLSWSLTFGDHVGDTIETALIVDVPSDESVEIPSFLDGDSDVDLFAVNLRAGDILTATTSSGEYLDTILRAFDEDGHELNFNDDYGGTFFSQVTFTAPIDGRFYVGVSNFPNSTYDPLDWIRSPRVIN